MDDLPSPYEILGIEKTDDPIAIKQAYKYMALKYHPDKNPNSGDKFQEISKAYQILANEDSKLFFDSFGYEGLILNEKLNSKGDKNFTEWLISMSFCLFSIVLDYFLGIYSEWIFASIFTLYFIYLTKKSPDISFCLFIIVLNLVLYFILPTKILPTITNTIIYGIVLLWPNITRKNSSLTVSIWILIIVFDLWRGITLNHWIWSILSINIIIFGSIILMLMGIYVLKKPETGPAIYSGLFEILFSSITNLDVMTLVFSLFWGPVWLLDFFFNRRIEWLIVPTIFLIKLFLFSGKLKIFLPMLLSSAIAYYLVPSWIYHFLNNYIVHALSHMLVYKFNIAIVEKASSLQEKKKYLFQKGVNQIIMGVILFAIQYMLDFSTEHWHFLGSISLGYSFVLMIELYFFSFSIKNLEDDGGNNMAGGEDQSNNQSNGDHNDPTRQNKTKKQKSHGEYSMPSNENAIQPYTPPPSFLRNLHKQVKRNQSFNQSNNNNNHSVNNNNKVQEIIEEQEEDRDKLIDEEEDQSSSSTTFDKQNGNSPTKKSTTTATPIGSSLDKRCQTCFKSTNLKKCGRCKQVFYCSKECQIKNWAFHQSICILKF
ncbi:hypothetical protein DFA_00872 [Cavenderia fasciculata]|uniref:J domain-containing protein n=1 Tax=Cavenderia fasciculata TaxID=261658 RepID=F4PU77_CACFS|nr:uncharacterized protein DFA_00872 [Cavenderia fasciculata]EGG21003.1 hypothetical protein DFA_00872 [Cavenderia fasciculata]|eukprot:XP_004358853.1 hypothetical protein DFA_00872 [Cavenderia fasciculata]